MWRRRRLPGCRPVWPGTAVCRAAPPVSGSHSLKMRRTLSTPLMRLGQRVQLAAAEHAGRRRHVLEEVAAAHLVGAA